MLRPPQTASDPIRVVITGTARRPLRHHRTHTSGLPLIWTLDNHKEAGGGSVFDRNRGLVAYTLAADRKVVVELRERTFAVLDDPVLAPAKDGPASGLFLATLPYL